MSQPLLPGRAFAALWLKGSSVFLTHALSSAIFLLRLGVWGGCGGKEEGREGFSVFEVRTPFYFLLLPPRAPGLETRPPSVGCQSAKPGGGGRPSSCSLFASGELPSSERRRWVDVNWWLVSEFYQIKVESKEERSICFCFSSAAQLSSILVTLCPVSCSRCPSDSSCCHHLWLLLEHVPQAH